MIIRSLLIARLSDGLPLAASTDDGDLSSASSNELMLSDYKATMKKIIVSAAASPESPNVSIEAGNFNYQYNSGFIYSVDKDLVIYIALSDKSESKKNVFAFLSEIKQLFRKESDEYSSVSSLNRPYAFVSFDMAIKKTRKSFDSPSSSSAATKGYLSAMADELEDVQRIMSKNINDVLERGEKISVLSSLSGQLSTESKKFLRESRRLNLVALYRKYGPPLLGLLLLLFFLYIWWNWSA